MVTAAMKLKDSCPWDEKLWQTKQSIKKQSHYFGDKGPQSQSYGFSSSYVWMWELYHKDVEHQGIDELMLLNCGVGEDSWESLGQQGDQTSLS